MKYIGIKKYCYHEKSEAGHLESPKWEMAYTKYFIMQNRLECCKVTL